MLGDCAYKLENYMMVPYKDFNNTKIFLLDNENIITLIQPHVTSLNVHFRC